MSFFQNLFAGCGSLVGDEDGCTCARRESHQELQFDHRGSIGSQGTYIPPDEVNKNTRATIMPEDEVASTKDDDESRGDDKAVNDDEQPRLPTLALAPPVAVERTLLSEQNLADHAQREQSQVITFEEDDATTYTQTRGPSVASSQALGNMLLEAEETTTETIKLDFDLSKGKLGLEITAMKHSVHVWKIQEPAEKLINIHNLANPAQKIQIGDQIVSVNNETKPKSIGMALKEAFRGGKVATICFRKRLREFTVCLNEQIPAPKLGVVCNISREPKVHIQSVKKGLIHSWSEKHPLRCVCMGDEVVEANGLIGDEIVKKLQSWVKTHDENLYLIIRARD